MRWRGNGSCCLLLVHWMVGSRIVVFSQTFILTWNCRCGISRSFDFVEAPVTAIGSAGQRVTLSGHVTRQVGWFWNWC